MPSMTGFELLDRLSEINFSVIITTAYSDYAITAIKKEAHDYLLKPVNEDDLKATIEKIKTHKEKAKSSDAFEKVLMNFNERITQKKIAINTDGKLIFIFPNDILYAEADGNYTTIYLEKNKQILMTKKIKEVEDILAETYFCRIHNSYIVNLHRIKEYYKTDAYVVMEDEKKIPVSRSRKPEFLNLI